MEQKLKSFQKDTKKHNRRERREIESLTPRLEKLLEIYRHERALLGDCQEFTDKHKALQLEWVNIASRWNNNKKHHIKADINAFAKQVEAMEKLEQATEGAQKLYQQKKAYDKWVKSMDTYLPNVLLRLKVRFWIVNLFKRKDRLYDHFQRKGTGYRFL